MLRIYVHMFVLLALLLTARPSLAQEEESLPPDEARALRDGMAETLEAKYRGGRNAAELHAPARWMPPKSAIRTG